MAKRSCRPAPIIDGGWTSGYRGGMADIWQVTTATSTCRSS
jgi:hypothetical protein